MCRLQYAAHVNLTRVDERVASDLVAEMQELFKREPSYKKTIFTVNAST